MLRLAEVFVTLALTSFLWAAQHFEFLGRLVTPWTRPGNRKELLAAILIAYVLAMKRGD